MDYSFGIPTAAAIQETERAKGATDAETNGKPIPGTWKSYRLQIRHDFLQIRHKQVAPILDASDFSEN